MAATDNHDLLSVLQSLFRRAFRMNITQRLNLHKRKPANDSVDLSSSLYQQIDKLSTTNRKDSAITASRVSTAADDVEQTSISSSRIKNSSSPSHSSSVSDLGVHLKYLHGNEYSESELGKRLQRSTWDHLHKSIYNAREGNPDIAKLHANISLQAMKEAHQYLSDEDYAKFTADLKQVIES